MNTDDRLIESRRFSILNSFPYSEKEKKLVTALGYEDFLWTNIAPHNLYQELALNCFLTLDATDKRYQTVQRCLIALNDKTCLRLTSAFDSLIDVE